MEGNGRYITACADVLRIYVKDNINNKSYVH